MEQNLIGQKNPLGMGGEAISIPEESIVAHALLLEAIRLAVVPLQALSRCYVNSPISVSVGQCFQSTGIETFRVLGDLLIIG